LPTEILLEICQDLDVQSIFYLAEVNRMFQTLVETNKASILLPILRREFSPFDELLQLFTASEEDLRNPGATYQPRRVIFRRAPGSTGIVLSPGGFASPSAANSFTSVRRGGKSKTTAPLPPPETAFIAERDMDSLLRYCVDIRKWEERFPQLRWMKEPANCRQLNKDEKERLRRSLYRWWLYAFYFHGDMPRPRRGQPEPCVDDIRTGHMRMYSTSELLDMLDLVATVKDLILHYICPVLEQFASKVRNRSLISRLTLANVSQGSVYSDGSSSEFSFLDDPVRRGKVVNTYAKLDPRELMYYFDNLYSYPRKRLLNDIRVRHPTFTRDQESLQTAIRSALDERHWLDNMPSLASDSAGGILDFGDERDEERKIFGADASRDGSLPGPAAYRPPHAEYSPRGDDGSVVEDDGPMYGQFGDRWTAAPAVSGRIAY